MTRRKQDAPLLQRWGGGLMSADRIVEAGRRAGKERACLEATLRSLIHPGQRALVASPVGNVTVKREAMRFVIEGQYAYSVEDAADLIQTLTR